MGYSSRSPALVKSTLSKFVPRPHGDKIADLIETGARHPVGANIRKIELDDAILQYNPPPQKMLHQLSNIEFAYIYN